GLVIYPSILPPKIQTTLLNSLLHTHLSNPLHKTNLHTHHTLPYQENTSFFSLPCRTPIPPTSPAHAPITTETLLTKKLRWMTLGGQYNWTTKRYPSSPPPQFPEEIASLVEGVVPGVKAEAAICNLYSAGDTLALHRDVAEECNAALVSVSVGCEGLFVAGLEGGGDDGGAAVRLRSGDVVVMRDEARWAWHGVPKICAGTCPDTVAEWPGEGFGGYKGWLRGKRVNLNVRQMFS
ncbi:hypothetical protein K470DRAFT_217473, partial [Piedraia hortae CBS 480.64]